MRVIKLTGKELTRIYERHLQTKKRVSEKVRKIIEDVRTNGDKALINYTRKFDKVELSSKNLSVSQAETSGAYQNINPHFVSTLKIAMESINRFYKRQLKTKKSWKMKLEDGVVLGENYQALERVGIYVPAGTAPLVSSAYMTLLLAKIAGVERIVLVTPPNKYGSVNPHILVVANLLKVEEIYKIGGAQAIAALAFGTKTIPRVDKIIGPGGIYVTEAKRQVFGCVDIDMLAGPSEVTIIADRYSNPSFVISDLKAQIEHVGGLAILVTTSKKLARLIKKEVEGGYIIIAGNLEQAAEIVNKIAPEHLQIMIKNPQKLIKKIRNAGSIFVGDYSPVAVGDYIAGPSHVLPTGGTARFFSGLGIDDFIKSSHIITYSKKALEKVKEPIEKLTEIEGLKKHLESIKIRFE